ncbi:PREDICTED: odorant receptor 4-like [Dufourea novaeangliae]|uniref:odorant receptor 4-like n=1 Tax=Dufourea novaeangliae TaxID=178035 RepID=UPI0007675248|nr:PREDICTED: odorant receptor 4-like [Dufourea novaeangliae]
MEKGSHVKMVNNVHHAEDYDYSIQVNRWILQPIGVWPSINKLSKAKWFLSFLLNLACHAVIMFTVAPCLMFILFEDESIHMRMKAIGPMSAMLMGELNYWSLSLKTKDILRCFDYLDTDWKMVGRPQDRRVMLKNAKVGRMVVTVAAFALNIGVFSHSLMAGFKKMEFNIGNDTYAMLRLPCPCYSKLIDARYSPINEIVFFVQVLSGLIVNLVTVGAYGFAAVFAMHVCGQLSIAMSYLDELVEPNMDQPNAQEKLGDIVDIHLRALNFVSHIEDVMHLTCLIELTGCTLNMCMLEYYMITESSKENAVAYGVIYLSMTFNVFIFCYIGEKISEQGEMVGEKAYMTEWYRLPYKTASGLILVILRSSTVTKITAGKVLPMSIATFASVVKTSFVYFNMIRTVTM